LGQKNIGLRLANVDNLYISAYKVNDWLSGLPYPEEFFLAGIIGILFDMGVVIWTPCVAGVE
jgi:hypothetical protein